MLINHLTGLHGWWKPTQKSSVWESMFEKTQIAVRTIEVFNTSI